jgi:hypothetical protein
MKYLYILFLFFYIQFSNAQTIILKNHVEGIVYDLQNNNPISNAKVEIEFGIDKYTAYTDNLGRYSIRTNVRYVDKEYYIKITHQKYYDLNGVVFVKEYALRNFGLKEKVIPITTFIDDTISKTVPSLDGYANNNWTILLDVSSSMNDVEKLNVLKSGIKDIIQLFRTDDIITIITFSSKVEQILEPCSGMEKAKIISAFDNIKFGGTSQGATAIDAAFKSASNNYIENGNNRILIFTDGMFSSGNKEYAKILKTIKLYKHKNINSSIFLLGNPTPYVIKNQEKLAVEGNGSFAVLNNEEIAKQKMLEEAMKVKN